MNKIILFGAFVFSQLSFAAQLTSVARVDLTKTPARPPSPFYFGTDLELKLIKTIDAREIVWAGYDKESICIGSTHRGVDSEVECDTEEVATWVPRVKLPLVKESLRARLTTQAGYDDQVLSSTGEYTLPSVCIQNFESYRYFGTEAPNDANAKLVVAADCASYLVENRIVYFEKARALKGNYLSASLYRTGLLKLNLGQPLTLSLKVAAKLPAEPQIVMNRQKNGDYPVLSMLAMTYDKKHNLFGEGYLYPELNDK